MKVFISADIEGTAFTTYWDETEKGKADYPRAAEEMTREVRAAIDGAMDAGADEILVNDAHDYGINLDPFRMPACVELIRGWSGSPMCMAEGVDESFDAAFFVGWHSPAGMCANPLSHTMSGKPAKVRLNGLPCSEFLLYSWACAMRGVPSVLLTGDKRLTEISRSLHPGLVTVAVKDGLGGLTRCKSPEWAEKTIRQAAAQALRHDLSKARVGLPSRFVFEITYKEVRNAVKYSFYPGFKMIADDTIRLTTGDYMNVLRAAMFCL